MQGKQQQNGRMEQFAILYKQVQAMLNGEKFSPFLKSELWAEAVNILTLLKKLSQETTFKPISENIW